MLASIFTAIMATCRCIGDSLINAEGGQMLVFVTWKPRWTRSVDLIVGRYVKYLRRGVEEVNSPKDNLA